MKEIQCQAIREAERQEHSAGCRVEVVRVWVSEQTAHIERNDHIIKDEIINEICSPTECGRIKGERNGFDPGSTRE